jgi:hypothetical protein
VAGPWFAVHRIGEGWKTLEKIWMSNGTRSNIAVVQTRLRMADDANLYPDDGSNVQGFNFALEVARVARDPQVSVVLKTQTPVIKQGQLPKLEAEVVNGRETPVTLVTPGDGSDAARRTPVIEWFVNDLPERRSAGSGSLPALRADEVATLRPGQRLPLGPAIGAPRLPVGKHRLVLRYTNAPDLKWASASPAAHDAAAMAKVQASTRITVESNAVEITVTE